MSDWTAEPKPAPEELDDTYTPHRYGDHTPFPTLADRIDNATFQQLIELARGGIGDPDA